MVTMEKQPQIKEVDIHLLDLRYAHTRIKNDKVLTRMQNSIRRYGQIVPVLVIPENNKFILIDGYLRLQSLQACGYDCVKLKAVEEDEAGALFVLLAKNNDRQWESIEQAALIGELHNRFSYSFGDIGKQLGRDKSWVKRRLDLIDSLPEEIRQAVMVGKISPWSASHVLVPLSRVNEEDAVLLTKELLKDPLSTRELSRLYEHYKKSNRVVRKRIIADPSLFVKTIQQHDQEREAKQVEAGPEGKWLKDISVVCHILKRLISASEYIFYPEQDIFQRRQRQIWIKKAAKMIVELKERAGRTPHDNTSIPADNSGDDQQRCGLT